MFFILPFVLGCIDKFYKQFFAFSAAARSLLHLSLVMSHLLYFLLVCGYHALCQIHAPPKSCFEKNY